MQPIPPITAFSVHQIKHRTATRLQYDFSRNAVGTQSENRNRGLHLCWSGSAIIVLTWLHLGAFTVHLCTQVSHPYTQKDTARGSFPAEPHYSLRSPRIKNQIKCPAFGGRIQSTPNATYRTQNSRPCSILAYMVKTCLEQPSINVVWTMMIINDVGPTILYHVSQDYQTCTTKLYEVDLTDYDDQARSQDFQRGGFFYSGKKWTLSLRGGGSHLGKMWTFVIYPMEHLAQRGGGLWNHV